MLGERVASLTTRLREIGWGVPARLRPDTERHPTSLRRVGLLLLLVAAAALRLKAIGLGNDSLVFQVDEDRNIALPLGLSWTDLKPRAPGYSVVYDYPALLWYMLFVLDHLVFRLGRLYGIAGPDWEAWRNLFAQNPIPFFLLGRTLSVALGTATVGLIYLLGRRLFSAAPGVLAAGFLASAFLHIRDSALATLDVPVTFFIVLSLLGSVAVFQQGRIRDYLLAAGAAGLATATKYNAFLVLIALVAAHWLRDRRAGRPFLRTLIASRLLGALLFAGVVFLALNPYLLLDWQKALKDLAWLSSRIQQGQYMDIGPAWWYHLAVSLRYGMGIGLLGIAVGGLARILWRRKPEGLVLVSFVVVFFLVTGSAKLIFVRYMEPLVPVLCLFAATAVWDLAGLTRRSGMRPWIATGIGLLVVVEPLSAAVAYGKLVHHTDTRVKAYRFIQTALPPGTAVATYGPSVTWRSTIPRFQPILYAKPPEQSWAEALATLKARGVRYFLTHHSTLEVFSPTIPELELALRHSATLIQEFEFSRAKVDASPRPVYDRVDPYYLPIGGFHGVKRPGPLVRLYRLD